MVTQSVYRYTSLVLILIIIALFAVDHIEQLSGLVDPSIKKMAIVGLFSVVVVLELLIKKTSPKKDNKETETEKVKDE